MALTGRRDGLLCLVPLTASRTALCRSAVLVENDLPAFESEPLASDMWSGFGRRFREQGE
jgi:hypothetical protein